VGLAFDANWNLFTNDNDHESRPDQYAPAKLLHVTPGIDFGWPRGWMASKSPDRSDLVEPMSAELGRGVPCDLIFHDEPSWPAESRGRLLMCRWDRHAVTSYKLAARGASFSADESVVLTGDNDARPIGIAATPDGRLLVTCLYMTGNQASPYCPSDLYEVTVVAAAKSAGPPQQDVSSLPTAKLWTELANGSWERRRRAHHEILRREDQHPAGELRSEAADRLLAADERDPTLPHLIWLAGSDNFLNERLVKLARSGEGKVRLQAMRVLVGRWPFKEVNKLFSDALDDPSPAARLIALEHFSRTGEPFPLRKIVQLASGDDTYLRQTAARLLAERAGDDDLHALVSDDDPRTRLAGVLAIGMKLTTPPLDEPPPAALPLFYPKENAFFKTQIKYADDPKPVDLRDLGRIGSFTMAEWWRTIPPTLAQQRLFDALASRLDDAEPAVALEAAYYLGLLRDDRVEAKLSATVYRIHRQRLAGFPLHAIDHAWRLGPFLDDSSKHAAISLENGVDLADTVKTPTGPQRWQQQSAESGKFPLRSPAAGKPWDAYACFTFQSRSRQPALLIVDGSAVAQVWQSGQSLTLPSAAATQEAILDLQPGTNEMVVQLRGDSAADSTVSIRWQAGEGVVAGVPELIDASLLADRLREAAKGSPGTAVPEEFARVDWVRDARSGDAAHGRQLFGTLGCVKCHAISPDQAGRGAPSLVDARRRLTVPHVVESILLPSKQVAEPFRASTLLTDDGRVLTGLVVSESAGSLELLMADGSRRTLERAKIEHRAPSELSPMPQGIVKTPDELRDLLTYLLGDRPLPP
jgi:putative heme-binding domain-containing protein